MQLTIKLIHQAAQTRAAHLMRVLSEDVIEALQADALPVGDGHALRWSHPCGAEVVISEHAPGQFLADIHAPGFCVSGGFAFFDRRNAERLARQIGGPTA